jgi:hypothetical protein
MGYLYYSNHWGKKWPDWGLNPGPSGTAPGALTTELPGLGDAGSAKSLDYKWGPMNVLIPGVDALVKCLSQVPSSCGCIAWSSHESRLIR